LYYHIIPIFTSFRFCYIQYFLCKLLISVQYASWQHNGRSAGKSIHTMVAEGEKRIQHLYIDLKKEVGTYIPHLNHQNWASMIGVCALFNWTLLRDNSRDIVLLFIQLTWSIDPRHGTGYICRVLQTTSERSKREAEIVAKFVHG